MPHDVNPTRRQLIASAAGLFGAAAVARVVTDSLRAGGGLLEASGNPPIVDTAAAESAAERLAIRPPVTVPPVTVPPDERFVVPPRGKIAFPVDPTAESYILDNFGDCRGSRQHIGTDIMSERGASVYAVEPGVLVQSYTNTGTAGWGWTLEGESGARYRYFHLDALADGLTEGDEVSIGQVIGGVGSSGNFMYEGGERVEDRSNIHLHFEYYPASASAAANPLPLLDVPDHISVGPPLRC